MLDENLASNAVKRHHQAATLFAGPPRLFLAHGLRTEATREPPTPATGVVQCTLTGASARCAIAARARQSWLACQTMRLGDGR